ncbi:MAG: DegT/DnrJ/EryC1/StrS aminotransferase family protein [Solirubrobacterales bacterium]|nr:DegT/DnrJ/EryC1/StrS aminotransferase family protein [Solirubrobacterales bacterium]
MFGKPAIEEAEIAEVVDSLRSGWIGSGPKVQRFEQMLGEYVGESEVRCVSSCTAALFLAMKTLGIGAGHEVIIPAMTFVASANAVEHTGAKAILVDVDPETGLIDLDAAEAAITPRTKAIMPVHLWGLPVEMDRVNSIRDRCGIEIIEDAAHALGAEWNGRPIGSFDNLTAYSFYVNKNITTIEGGALVARDSGTATRIEQLALHGLSAGAWQRFSDAGFKHYEATEPGYKFNMTDVQAALGIHQLPRLDRWIDRRAEIWDSYDRDLADLPLTLPAAVPDHVRHARHIYQVRLRPDAGLTRDQLLEELHRRNIGTGVHYRGVHLHPYYRDRDGIDPSSLPNATEISETTLSLPLHSLLTEKDRVDVVEALQEILAQPQRGRRSA